MNENESDWRTQIAEIADGWLFSDVVGLFPERVLIPFENPDYFNWEQYHGRIGNVLLHKGIAIGDYQGRRIGILKSKFGSAAACFATHLLANRGVKKIVAIGYCGGIHPQYRSGQIVVSTSASRISCTSRRYIPVQSDIEASAGLLAAATSIAAVESLPLVYARTVSTDDILLESSVQMQTLFDAGIHAIDMECGGLYALGSFFQIETVALMVVSDNPLSRQKADYAKVYEGMTVAIKLGLSILTS